MERTWGCPWGSLERQAKLVLRSDQIINDQISLPRGEASIEDILLGQSQLATNFETDLSFGLSYTFGSLYNNVINTRL